MNSGVYFYFTNWNMTADSEADCFVIWRNDYSTIEKRLINDLYIIKQLFHSLLS